MPSFDAPDIILLIENGTRRQSLINTLKVLGYSFTDLSQQNILKTENFPQKSLVVVDEENVNQSPKKVVLFKKQNVSDLLPLIIVLTQNPNALGIPKLEYDDVIPVSIDKQTLFIKISTWFNFIKKLNKLRVDEQKYRDLIEFSPDGILIQSEDKIVFANKTMMRILGASDPFLLLGRSMLDIVHPDYQATTKEEILSFVNEGQKKIELIEQKMLRFDGKIIEVEVSANPLIYEGRSALEVIVHDVTKRKEIERQLAHLAYHDPLTGLHNRTALIEAINQAILIAKRHKEHIGVLFLDLDFFKKVNDTLGHQKGDLLLQEVSARLLGCVRKSDIVARLGGDEFTLVILDVINIEKVALVAQKVLKTFSEPIVIDGQELFITLSIGISIYPNDGEDPQSLLKNADIAMYLAKEQGRNNYQYCTPELTEKIQKRSTIEKNLRHAVKQRDFQLLFSPKIDVNTRKVIGAEALLRWILPDGKVVPPNDFIPLAEETGLIVPITEWVLREACIQAKIWQREGFNGLKVSINFSGRNFKESNFINIIQDVLTETKLSSKNLDLEITEGFLLQNLGNALTFVKKLKDMGIQISIDDFGMGYSSLSCLKKFNIDRLKIDRIFIHDITVESDGAVITDAIIAIAHSLKAKVVAEGVETKEQVLLLKEKGCEEMQGYYFCKPVPAKELLVFLRENPSIKI